MVGPLGFELYGVYCITLVESVANGFRTYRGMAKTLDSIDYTKFSLHGVRMKIKKYT